MKNKKRNRSLFLFLSCGIVLSGYLTGILSVDAMKRAVSYGTYPILVVQHYCISPLTNFVHEKRTLADLHNKIRQLQEEKDAMVGDAIALKASLNYAEDIKEVLGFKQHYADKNARLVRVLAKNISEQAHFYLIDAGSQAGIKKNMIALYNNGIIGKVEEVFPLYSKVTLITDRSCKVAACCAKTHAEGIYEGCNSESSASLNRVSHLASMQENDLVISTGQGLIFPQGFGLGIVRKYQRDSVTYQIELEPLFDFHALRYCYVIENKTNGDFA